MVVQLVVASGNRMGHIIPVSEAKFIIGRAEDCHLRAQSELISRYHCAILVGNKTVVRDLGSKNGIRLNGEKVSAEKELNNGDKLIVGPLEFYIHITDANMPPGSSTEFRMHWERPDEDTNPGAADPTVLLNHLMSLNQEEHADEQPPETNPLKKLL